MKSKRKKPNIFLDGVGGSLLYILAVSLFVTGLTVARQAADYNSYTALVEHGGTAQATVVDIKESHGRHSTSYRPVGRYKVNGYTLYHTFRNVRQGKDDWSVGDSFSIRYDKKEPSKAVVFGSPALIKQHDEKVNTTIASIISGILVLGYMFTVGFNRYRRTHPASPRQNRRRKSSGRH
jgi:hypothetical protein